MDISYEKAIIPEMYWKSILRVSMTCLLIVFIFLTLRISYPNAGRKGIVIQNIPSRGRPLEKKTKSILLCFDKKLQLENLNLLLSGDPYDQLFNVPINPNLRETGIDGSMATKKVAGSKVIYKVHLPIPVLVREVILDMGVQNYENLFIFLEDENSNRIWEQNVKMGPGRYHKVAIRDRDIYIWT